jgi:menaquinone-dependent protoporphyrinogen oxidase
MCSQLEGMMGVTVREIPHGSCLPCSPTCGATTMSRTLILYSTTDGQTRRICERLRDLVQGEGQEVELVSVAERPETDPAAFDRVVIGASIRYGHHSPQIVDYITRNQAALEARPNAFFSVNLVARKPGKDTPETNPYLRTFLKKIDWRPQRLAVFAGKLDYPRYGFWDRSVIQLIMLLTRGPTDPQAVVEFTDWERVEDFGRTITDM